MLLVFFTRQRLQERGFICNRIKFDVVASSVRSHDTDRDCWRNRVDLKTLPKVKSFQNDTVSPVVQTAKPHQFEYGYYFARNLHCLIQSGEF